MIIKKKSTLEFYKIFFSRRDEGQIPFFRTEESDLWRAFVDMLNDGNRERKIREKKHKMWIDSMDDVYLYGFTSRENHNGAMIERETFEITLAQDENSKQELASLSHFVIDLKDNVLALERFDGGISKQGFFEYCNWFFSQGLNFSVEIRPIVRNDLMEILNDVTKIFSFSAKYNDIARINPDFIKNNIKSKHERMGIALKNPKYQARLRIDFTEEGLEINQSDTIIQRLIRRLTKKDQKNIQNCEDIEEDGWLDGKIEIQTKHGREEVISLQENLFVTKIDFETEESTTREDFSKKCYMKIVEKIQDMREKNR